MEMITYWWRTHLPEKQIHPQLLLHYLKHKVKGHMTDFGHLGINLLQKHNPHRDRHEALCKEGIHKICPLLPWNPNLLHHQILHISYLSTRVRKGTSLAVQWLIKTLGPSARGKGLIPSQGTKILKKEKIRKAWVNTVHGGKHLCSESYQRRVWLCSRASEIIVYEFTHVSSVTSYKAE